MRKELTTFLVVLLLIICTVLGILLLNAKRQIFQLSTTTPKVAQTADQAPKKEIVLPTARTYTTVIPLPTPKLKGTVSVEQAIAERRSQRAYKDEPMTMQQLSQMLWAGQGITEPKTGKRTAPSAFEVYPYTMYVLVRNVIGLQPGLYEYLPTQHALGDMKLADANTLLNNSGIEAVAKNSPVVVLLSAALDKGVAKLKTGAVPSAYLEGGHIGQNMYLEAQSLQLGMVVTGGVGTAAKALQLDPAETVVYVIPMGVPAPPAPTEK